MAEDFLKFDSDKLNLDDFNFNVSSAIPENELLEFPSFDNVQDGNLHNNNNNNNGHSTDHSHLDPFPIQANHINASTNNDNHLDPSKILQSYDSHFSPVASPYTADSMHISSFQPQSIQGSLSQAIRGRQSSISGSTRNNSLYDSLDVPSPGGASLGQHSRMSAAYFSPVSTAIPESANSRHTSIQMGSITSPSYNDAFSPYSSFDPSSFKSPTSTGASPIPSGSFNGSTSLPKQQLSKEDKLRRRREFHNQVERRRRDLIKEKIKELGGIVPPSLLYTDEEGKEIKASKNVIINKTVDYVAHLHKVMAEQESRREKLQQKIAELEAITGGVSSSQTPASATGTPHSTSQQNQQTQQNSQFQQTYTSPQQKQDYKPPQSQAQPHRSQIQASTTQQWQHVQPSRYEGNDYNGSDELSSLNSKIEHGHEGTMEAFDVNEFLKEHNETWDHSNV